MYDRPTEQVENRVNSDLRRQSRSFNNLAKKPRKPWSASTLRLFPLYSIGFITGIWGFVTKSGYTKPWIGIVVTLGVSAIIVVPILLMENTRVTNPAKRRSRTHRYVNALIFVGIAVAVGFSGWIVGAAIVGAAMIKLVG